MSKCIVESFCFLRSWDGKLVSSKSLHLFTSSVHAWKIFAFLYHVFKFLYRSIHGVLIQGYAVDYSLHMVTSSAQLRKQCHHISMFGKWMLDIALVILFFWASQPLSKYSYYCIYCIHYYYDSHSTVLYIIFALWRHSRETAIPTLVTKDLQYVVADIGNLYFSR